VLISASPVVLVQSIEHAVVSVNKSCLLELVTRMIIYYGTGKSFSRVDGNADHRGESQRHPSEDST
jgi:hypothetical protein